jgi:exodeoxyribonuclease VII large subunit
VWTGIGHTGDRSVADEVAQRALVTPTQCGEAVVATVSKYLEDVERIARRLSSSVDARLDEASRSLQARSSLLRRGVTQGLTSSLQALRATEMRVGSAALVTIERSRGHLANRAQRLGSLSVQQVAVQAERVEHDRELLRVLDPRRQLERGWSLTRDEQGQVVRTAASLRRGGRLVTTFAHGSAVSVVGEICPGPDLKVDDAGVPADGGEP